MLAIRPYRPADCEALAALFFRTVHTVNARDYTSAQLDAWADGQVDIAAWNASFLRHHTVVAEVDGTIVGFGDIDRGGYLDRLYVHADYQRQGIATAICDTLEAAVDTPTVTTHASITARGFFERRGYRVIRRQQVHRHGVAMENYVMERIMIQKNIR